MPRKSTKKTGGAKRRAPRRVQHGGLILGNLLAKMPGPAGKIGQMMNNGQGLLFSLPGMPQFPRF